jgi:triosephosphate isomerase
MSRRPLVAGNWKLNPGTRAEAVALAKALVEGLPADAPADVAVAPVFVHLPAVAEVLAGTPIALSGQTSAYAEAGAHTGEIGPSQLVDLGCRHVLVGHSERRARFGETDAIVRQKLEAALAAGLLPILCVGETLEEREADRTEMVVLGQVDAALKDLEHATKVTLAYEPVWAIGTGRTAAPADAQAVHAAIRGRLATLTGAAATTRILYGGSVKPSNAAELMAQTDIDGALVGGASLKAETFIPIVTAAG